MKREEHRWRVAELGVSPFPQTYRDYSDMNLRYLRSTGLFGLIRVVAFCLEDTKSALINGLLAEQKYLNTMLHTTNLRTLQHYPLIKEILL